MSDEQYALSPAPLQAPPPTEADYEAIFAAVMETVRGRWFLSEFGRRNRQADTQIVLGAIERLEAMVRGERADPSFDRIRSDIRDMADAIAATRREIAAIRHDDDHKGIGEATEELDAIVMATERATSDILAAAETIQETAWTLREQGLDAASCDHLDRCATDVYLACSFQDLTGQRTRKVIHVLRFLEGRINAMVEILGDDVRPKDQPARPHAPLDIDMDQEEIDAVIPTTQAERAAPFAESMAVAPAAEVSLDPAPIAAAELQADEAVPSTDAEAAFDTSPAALSGFSPEPAEAEAGETAPDELAFVPPSLTPTEPSLADDADIFSDAAAAGGQAETTTYTHPEAAAMEPSAGDFLATVDFVADVVAPPESNSNGEADRSEGGFTPDLEAPGDDVVLLADSTPMAALADSVAAAGAEAPDDGATAVEFTEGAYGAGADAKALMADLLALIRPNERSDASESTGPTACAPPDETATARLDESTPPREDLRLMRPIASGALPSDFVIVPLASDADVPDAEPPRSAETSVATKAAETLTEVATDLTSPPVEPDSTAVVIVAMTDETGPDVAVDDESAAAVEETAFEPAVAGGIERSELDNDLLMAAEALGPRPTPRIDEPAPARAEISGHAAADSESPMSISDVSPEAVPDPDGPAAMPTEPVDADIMAPESPGPAIAGDTGVTDDATVTMTDETAAPPEVREGLAVAPPAGEDRASDQPVVQAVAILPQPALTASATAALAVLAMSATASLTSETGADSGREEVVGHADPLAAVNALSVEERIALFS